MSRVFSWSAVVGWMALIFYLSHQPASASASLSFGVTDWLLSVIRVALPSWGLELDQFHFFVRKAAHFFAYFVLGVLSFHAFLKSGVHVRKSVIFAFLFSVLYAISDETHQLFVQGRAAQVLDVLIDSVGAFFGIIVSASIKRLQKSNGK